MNQASRKIPYNKPPTTFAEQVNKLKARGLIIGDKENAEFYLSQLNYYRFAAYCLPFEAEHSTHQFKENVHFEDVLNTYIFDRELRLLLMDAIERIEVSFRTQFAYYLSHNYNTAHPHLLPAIFKNQHIYNESINRMHEEVNNSGEDFIAHLTRKYQEALPPIWAVVELMTIGQLSKWFANIEKRRDVKSICRIYNLDPQIITSYLKHITTVRNHCAHHARVWNRSFTLTVTIPKIGLTDLVRSFNQDEQAKRRLYNGMALTTYLMDIISPGNHWKQRLLNLIEKHKLDPHPMGFPDNWKTLPIWQNAINLDEEE